MARASKGTCLLCEYARLEAEAGDRVVEENEGFLAVVPFWAIWPFETMLLSRRHLAVHRPTLRRRSATCWRTS